MKVFAVDPGKVTGYAVWIDGILMGSGELPHYEFLALAEKTVPTCTAVACEDYRVTPATLKKTWQPWSLYQIGTLDYWCRASGVEFALATPAEAKGFATDERLRALGWWFPGVGHARDAGRHLLLYLVRVGALSPATLVI